MSSQALFSTTFFTFDDNGWKVSKGLWLYWIITIPSTILVLALWRIRLYGLPDFLFLLQWKEVCERTRPVKQLEKV
jgi:hypothetical protein